MDRRQLAAFLRSRRARLRPADVGLTPGPRRRTPGLRREEVAGLAGISVDYYTRLEQARGPRPSRQVLSALARALRLYEAERAYLYHLVGEEPAPPGGPSPDVPAGVLHLLDRLDDTPAYVIDARYDLLAWNPLAAALLGDPAAGDERTAVWVEFSTVETEYGQRIDYHERRTAFDRRTGMIVDCCESYVDDVPGARQSGLAFRLPFAAAPRDHPNYDPVLRRQVTLRYDGEDTVAGLPVYRYTATAGPVKVEDLPDVYTAEALGLKQTPRGAKNAARGAAGFVPVSRYVRITRTLWVEPESGLPVRMREQRRDTLRTADQVDRLVTFEADMVTDPGDEAVFAAEARSFRTFAILARDVLPPVFGAAAPVAAIAAWWAGRRRRGSAPAQHEQQVPGHDLAQAR